MDLGIVNKCLDTKRVKYYEQWYYPILKQQWRQNRIGIAVFLDHGWSIERFSQNASNYLKQLEQTLQMLALSQMMTNPFERPLK